jgi:hypothetical protein
MPAWRLDNDVVTLAGLRLRLHRIGLAHWRGGSTLRSWGAAPLYADGDALHAPCAAGEALWLGAWLEDEASGAHVRLADGASNGAADIALPGEFQIGALLDGKGAAQPIVAATRALALELAANGTRATLALHVHEPTKWAALARRAPPARLHGPPPLPPRLG